MNRLKERYLEIAIILLGVLAVYFRFISLPVRNKDLGGYITWYQILIHQGILHGLSSNFSIYTPPYTYLLAIATLTSSFLSTITAIKLIPIAFDLLNAIFIYRIVKLRFPVGKLPHLAAVLFLSAPTIIMNSSLWGQIDSIYTSFLLICLFFLLVEKPFYSMLAFGMACAIKAQAVFLLAFLIFMVLKKQIPCFYFGIVPIVYLLTILPVVLLGRPLMDTLLIYLRQSHEFLFLSMNAPNLYIFMPGSWYQVGVIAGIYLTIIILYIWIRMSARVDHKPTINYYLLAALASVALTPFLLPKMHDRYFYPADVLSIVVAFFWPALWFLPFLYQIISTLAYINYFYNLSVQTLFAAALLNAITVAVILRTQFQYYGPIKMNEKISAILTWLVTILVPIALIGLCVSMVLTPEFLRIEYNTPNFPADEYGFTTQDRLHWSSYAFDYLLNNRDIRYLGRLQFENGQQVFNDRERLHMEDVKVVIQHTLVIWRISLITLMLLGLLAWIGNRLPDYRDGMRRGGWLSAGLVIAIGLFATLAFWKFFTVFHSLFFKGDSWLFAYSDTLIRLFPLRFWQDVFLFSPAVILAVGLALGVGLKPKNITAESASEKI
jgi:integral membrane protein (TIGR01906 family)